MNNLNSSTRKDLAYQRTPTGIILIFFSRIQLEIALGTSSSIALGNCSRNPSKLFAEYGESSTFFSQAILWDSFRDFYKISVYEITSGFIPPFHGEFSKLFPKNVIENMETSKSSSEKKMFRIQSKVGQVI